MSSAPVARPHVVVVGDVGLDVVAKLAGPVVFGHDTRAGITDPRFPKESGRFGGGFWQGFPRQPPMGGSGRGYGRNVPPQYGFKPSFLTRPPSAG